MSPTGEWLGLSWDEVHQAVVEVTAGLLALEAAHGPARRGQVGFVIGANSPEYFIAEYALQASRIAAFPLFEPMTAPEMLSTLASYPVDVAFSGSEDATSRLLIAADDLGLRQIVQWGDDPLVHDARVISLADLRTRGVELRHDDPAVVDKRIDSGTLDDIACIILTSGTTGISKGVLGSHRYMLDVAARYAHVYGAQPRDRYLSYLPAAFSVEQYNGLTLAAALPLEVAFSSSAASVGDEFISSRSSMKFLVPRQWEELRASLPVEILDDADAISAGRSGIRTRLGLQHVTGCINAGGSLSAGVFDFFRQLGLHIRNVYGFAEVGIIASTRDDDPPESGGVPLPTAYGSEPIRLRIEDGEIQTTGGVRCSGYWNQAEHLAITPDGWLRSGDAGVIDEGVLQVLDRVANIQHLPDGRTFAPQPIEISAMRSPFLANIVLIGGHGEDSRIAALLQVNEPAVRRRLEASDALPEDYQAVVASPSVVRLMVDEIRKLNAEQPPSQRIELIALLPKPLSVEDGELTRSMKLRRSAVVSRYHELVDATFTAPAGRVSFNVESPDGQRIELASLVVHI
jgi:long-chain acyl-CoA synthetase